MTWILPWIGNEIVFRHPERMWLLLLVGLLLAVAGWEALRRKRVWQNPWHRIHRETASLPGFIKRISWWFFLSLGLTLVIFVIAVPEERFTEQEPVYGRIRLTFEVDTSLSKFFAEDVKPNRMSATKALLTKLVGMLKRDPELKGRYEIALIPFAGTANPVFASFTVSSEAILASIARLDAQTVKKKGTSVWAALKAYDELLLWYPPWEEKGEEGTTVDLGFLISDGGREEGKGTELVHIPPLMQELRDPYRTQEIFENQRFVFSGPNRKRNVVVNTVGVGAVRVTEDGGRLGIPTELVIRDRDGRFRCYYREDDPNPLESKCKGNGKILTSALDEEILRVVAELGGGKYYHFFENQEKLLSEFKSTILQNRKEIGRRPRDRYEPAVRWFALPAFLIFYFLFGYGGWMRRACIRLSEGVRRVFKS